MNRRVHNKSLVVLFFIYFCIVALFADGANITDLFPSTRTIHFDEVLSVVPGSPEATAVSSGSLDFYSNGNVPLSLNAPGTFKARFVMLDQDSPSEAAVTTSNCESIGAVTTPDQTCFCEVFPHDNLYLNYCTLLL